MAHRVRCAEWVLAARHGDGLERNVVDARREGVVMVDSRVLSCSETDVNGNRGRGLEATVCLRAERIIAEFRSSCME